MNRRDFLKLLGLAGGAAVVGAGREQHDGDELDTVLVHPDADMSDSWDVLPSQYNARNVRLAMAHWPDGRLEWVIDSE